MNPKVVDLIQLIFAALSGIVVGGLVEYFKLLRSYNEAISGVERGSDESESNFKARLQLHCIMHRVKIPVLSESLAANAIIPLFLFGVFNFKNYSPVVHSFVFIAIILLLIFNELNGKHYLSSNKYKIVISIFWVAYCGYLFIFS